jgi:preprotein translocase subunit SecA
LIDQLKSLDPDLSDDEIKKSNRKELEQLTALVVNEHYRPEMRRMERGLLLQILDTAWKDHLLAMDHLRSSVNLRGYAQVDPKVEFKREGMKQFETMWLSIGDRVTDLFFKMEQLDESFVGSTWKETAAIHEEAPSQTDIGDQQQSAIDNSQGQAQKLEPIRNRGEKVGRNDPCPCNSGKKYKNCCMRKGGSGIAASIM